MCGRTDDACRRIKGLRKVDFFRTLLAIIEEKIIAPLEKILDAPLAACTCTHRYNGVTMLR